MSALGYESAAPVTVRARGTLGRWQKIATQATNRTLSERWKGRLEENLAEATFSASELNDLAERHRALALVAEGPGQRRAAITVAERYENAALERAVVRGEPV